MNVIPMPSPGLGRLRVGGLASQTSCLVSKEVSNLRPPLASMVKEQLIKFSKEQIEFSLNASFCKAIHLDVCHPT